MSIILLHTVKDLGFPRKQSLLVSFLCHPSSSACCWCKHSDTSPTHTHTHPNLRSEADHHLSAFIHILYSPPGHHWYPTSAEPPEFFCRCCDSWEDYEVNRSDTADPCGANRTEVRHNFQNCLQIYVIFKRFSGDDCVRMYSTKEKRHAFWLKIVIFIILNLIYNIQTFTIFCTITLCFSPNRSKP